MTQSLGPYVLEAELGRGGMGVVWRAHDPALDRTVAIKVLLTGLAGPDDLLRFRREAQAQARLRHPSIVGLLTVGTTPTGQPYLVMDHVEGESLAARVQRAGPLPPAEAARIVARLARAAHYAHTRGVLHRDLKARNVLLDLTGEPLLIDFGLAALTGRERLTATGEAVGTPGCMAPEQVGDRDRIGPRTDVYGLGALLHEALTGRPPFEGREVLRVLADVVGRPAGPPSSLRPEVPPVLDQVVLRCLEKDPDLRYPSAEAVAIALEALAPGGGPRREARGGARWSGAGGLVVGAALGLAAPLLLGRPGLPAPPAGPTTAAASSATSALPGQASLERVRGGDLDGARPLVAAALDGAAARDVAQALLARAHLRAADRESDLGFEDLDAAVTLAPGLGPEGLMERATARILAGEVAGAQRDLQALEGLREPRVLVFRARTLALMNGEGALAAAEEAVTATGGVDPRAHGARAFARIGGGDEAGSRADVTAALARDPGEPLALLVAAGLFEEGRVERASAALARAGAERDRLLESVAYSVRGRALAVASATEEDQRRGLEDLDRAVELAPGTRRAAHLRAKLRLSLAERAPQDRRRELLEGAREDGERLDELTEHEPLVCHLLAHIQAALALDPARGLDVAEGASAVATLTRGLERSPGELSLLAARAELRVSLGDLAGAEGDARALLARSAGPDASEHRTAAVTVLARLRNRRGDAQEALALLDRALGPGAHRSASALAERALSRVALRDAAGGRADADEALRLDPRSARAHLADARAHFAAGESGRLARAALDAAIERAPGFALALSDRAFHRFTRAPRDPREAGEARADLAAAQRLEPWAAEHVAIEALLLSAQGDAARAEEALARTLSLDPASPLARQHRGRLRLRAGDARGALVDLQLAAERQPWVQATFDLITQARQQLGDLAGALEAAGRAVELADGESALGRAHRLRAGVHISLEDWPAALADAERAVALAPRDSDSLGMRGKSRVGGGDAAGGLLDLDAALALDPQDPGLRLERAAALLALGERTQALEELEAVLERVPPDGPTARRARAVLERARR